MPEDRVYSQSKRFIASVVIIAACCLLYPALPARSQGQAGIANTKHNLSVTGPGEIKSLVETRICVFCHTPHNAAPLTPLWNKEIKPQNYVLYESTTLHVVPHQPTGPTRLCLSCHDGTIALGAVLKPAEGIQMVGEITPSRPSYIGTFLADHHPVSFPYFEATVNPEISPVPPPDLVLYGGEVHCSTCHDAHRNVYKKFLRVDNTFSALCTRCHNKDGWLLTTHKTSPSTWNGVPPDPWPRTGVSSDFGWLTVAQNGCESCHTPHGAKGPQRLLNYLEEENNCYPCHNGNVAAKNIQAQFQKFSRHPVELTTIGVTANHHEPNERPALITGHVECVDCHNPHATNGRTATPPFITGRLEKVSGVDINGVALVPPTAYATKEYEVCFKCHADSSPEYPLVARVISTANTRFEFDLANPSYHPVVGTGKNSNVPSLMPPSQDPEVPLGLSPSSIIYCTDCHSDSGGTSNGPHGSDYVPILRRQYLTADGTSESFQSYSLCYRCHNQSSILGDQSFPLHNIHIVGQKTPCSVCHDPHGIRDNGLSGSHTHLINFDSTVVTPTTGNMAPLYADRGTFSGSCTLVCHGRIHDNESYSPGGLLPQKLRLSPKRRIR